MSEIINETKPDLYSMTEEELVSFFASIGEPKFRAKQTFAAVAKGTPISEMTNLSKALREKLSEQCEDRLPSIERKLVSEHVVAHASLACNLYFRIFMVMNGSRRRDGIEKSALKLELQRFSAHLKR